MITTQLVKHNMRSRLSANKNRGKNFILKWWHFLIFFAISLIILYYVIPQNSMLSYLQHSKPNAVSLAYLRNLVARNPKEPTYKILLANQELSLGNVADAEKLVTPYYTLNPTNKLQWDALWSQYLITRTKAYALNKNDPTRNQLENQLKEIVNKLAYSPYLNADELASVANDAVSLGSVRTGVTLYQRLATLNTDIPASYFADAAKVALFISDYRASANLYFAAQEHTNDITQKRNYFINGLKSLQSGNLNDQALSAAKQHIGILAHDPLTLDYLAKIAITAGKPDMALKFVEQMLQLQHWSN